MTQEELKNYLIEEAEYTEHEVEEMSSYELLNAYLEWNGMLGWTADVISAVQGAYDLLPGALENPYEC